MQLSPRTRFWQLAKAHTLTPADRVRIAIREEKRVAKKAVRRG